MLCDESNTGLGRIGNEYWGHKWRNHRPDVVTLGNSLGNGLPLSAVVTRQEISSAMKHVFFNTFSAGHMQCKISLAVLDIIKRDNLA